MLLHQTTTQGVANSSSTYRRGRGRDELRGEGWQHSTKQTSKPTGLTVWTSNICHCVVTIKNQKESKHLCLKTITVDNIEDNCL